MRRMKVLARKLMASQIVAQWHKQLMCKTGEWNCTKILKEIECQLRDCRRGIEKKEVSGE